MSRVVESPRNDFERKVKDDGLCFCDLEGLKWENLGYTDNYWTEEGAVEITAKAEREIVEATFKLHCMCLELVDRVVADDVLMTMFEIPRELWPTIRRSWKVKKT